MNYDYRLTTLPNGIRIASFEMPHMQSVSVGFWIGVGGRYESECESGISHFIEHLLFKGTEKRNARQLSEAVEGIGGYLNAFTTEDHTCYYAKAAAAHLPRLCDVLVDMFKNSQFAPDEIERERDVIKEEILMYRDHPAQHSQELLTETMWPGHPLGRPLTGTVETIAKFKRPQLLGFRGQNYNGRTTVVTVAGKARHEDVVELLAPLLADVPAGKTPRYTQWRPRKPATNLSLVTHDTEQTHLAIGFHAFGRQDERRFALKLLSVILGENMSSRLFQKLREKHGFCYSVHSGMVSLSDAGLLNIYAGLDPSKLQRAVQMILQELQRVCHRAPSKDELRKAQDYTIGQTLISLESTTNQMMWMGESILGYRKILNPAEIEQKILEVTPEEVRAVACICLNRDGLGAAIVGPVKDAEQVKTWLAA